MKMIQLITGKVSQIPKVGKLTAIKYSLASIIVLLTACSAATINIEGTFPSPLVQKLPLTVGVYYDEAFINHSFIEINDNTGDDQYIINSGASLHELFNSILPALFEDEVQMDLLVIASRMS